MSTVLVVGAIGSIGRHVVAEALDAGYQTLALVRAPGRAKGLPTGAQPVVGDLTDPGTLREAVAGVTGIVFTHGSHGDAHTVEIVDYGAVRNVLGALKSPARVALMTAIGVTSTPPATTGSAAGNGSCATGGLPYTIVRPGWFDYSEPDH
jgi:uncharacterized protein YbjT (DUF2867 family)